MSYKYILYDSAREKLDNSEISEVLEKKIKDYEIPHLGFVSSRDVQEYIQEMSERDYFKKLRSVNKDEYDRLLKGLQDSFSKVNKEEERNPTWKVERYEGLVEKQMDEDDFLILSGWWASQILPPQDLWDYSRYGFDNLSDFVGSLGVLVKQSITHQDKGYSWKTTLDDGRTFDSIITGTIHLDPFIGRKDITPYISFNPLGEKVSFRPKFDEDISGFGAGHSSEQSILASLLKYAEQTNVESELLKNNGENLLEFSSSLTQKVGHATECMMDQSGSVESILFLNPLHKINKNDFVILPENYLTHVIDSRGVFIGKNDEYVIARKYNAEQITEEDIQLTLYPEEFDEVLKSLFVQSAEGLGRTALVRLNDLVKYSFSEEKKKFISNLEKP